MGTLLPINITIVESSTTPVPVVGTLLPINITNVKSGTTPSPVVGTLLTNNLTNRHLQIERAYVDIGPFKKIYQREYLWNHTYHIPKY